VTYVRCVSCQLRFLLELSLLTASILLSLLNFVNECMWSLLAIPPVFCIEGMDNVMETLDRRGIKLLLAALKER